jgi:serine/threonine protein kinase
MPIACPDEIELLPLITGDSIDETIQSHVADCAACNLRLARLKSDIAGFRDTSTDRGPASAAGAALAGRPQTKPRARPDSIGNYVVIDYLGAGGQAEVFLVMHPILKRPLVLKWSLRPMGADLRADDREAEDGGPGDRLIAEGKLLSQIQRPNLAHVHDLGFEDRRAYIVMDHIQGRTLAQYASQRKPGFDECARIVARAARAAGAAHALGITHRDVTPRNIIMDAAGEPWLIDFGLALFRGPYSQSDEQMGTVAGTRDFMSPEQAMGRTDLIGPSTDIYALGAVLRDLLLGSTISQRSTQPDWSSESPGSAADIVHLEKAGVPAPLTAIVARAMAEKPADRFDSAEDLADALEAAVRPRRRLPLATRLALALMAAACLAVLWMYFFYAPLPPRVQDFLRLSDADSITASLPLQGNVNMLMSIDLPRGTSPIAFTVDPTGLVERVTDPWRRTRSFPYDHWECWRDQGVHFDPHDPPGTKLIVVAAVRGTPSDAQAARLKEALARFAKVHPLPLLSRTCIAEISSHAPATIKFATMRGLERQNITPNDQVVMAQLNTLRQPLQEAGANYFAAVAVPYINPPSASQP